MPVISYDNPLQTLEGAHGGEGLPSLPLDQRIIFLALCNQRLCQNEEPSNVPPTSSITVMMQLDTPDCLLLMERLIASIRASFQSGEGQTY